MLASNMLGFSAALSNTKHFQTLQLQTWCSVCSFRPIVIRTEQPMTQQSPGSSFHCPQYKWRGRGCEIYERGVESTWGHSWSCIIHNNYCLVHLCWYRRWENSDVLSWENRSHPPRSGPTGFPAGVDKISVSSPSFISGSSEGRQVLLLQDVRAFVVYFVTQHSFVQSA